MIVNLLGVKLEDRPHFFATLLLRLHEAAHAAAGRTGYSWTRPTICCPPPGTRLRTS